MAMVAKGYSPLLHDGKNPPMNHDQSDMIVLSNAAWKMPLILPIYV
jgi:hypothetical protein